MSDTTSSRIRRAIGIKDTITHQHEEEKKTPLLESISELIRCDKMISTGSTLLDLCISGLRVRGGGIPGGMVAEFFGPPGIGKTAILEELASSATVRGGSVRYLDPEGRLDREYARIFGVNITEEDYFKPNTVSEMFKSIWNWDPPTKDNINVLATDSLAALSTELEMDNEDGDKMGMKRAKDFSAGFRKTARQLSNSRVLLACSNQTRSEGTPGGEAIKFYSSLRVSMTKPFQNHQLKRTKTIGKSTTEKVFGIRAQCQIIKNDIDDCFRKCYVSIIFGYGLDDIRENLIYLLENTGKDRFEFQGNSWAKTQIQKAIDWVEENKAEDALRQEVTTLWEGIESQLKQSRVPKRRM